jgi:NitT/TauT family transport system permease protein
VRDGVTRRLRGWGLGLLGLVALGVVWEVYKALGPAAGVEVGGRVVLPRTGDRAMPHLWDIAGRLTEPALGRSGDPLWQVVGHACLFSLKIAAIGWVVGVVVGLALALLMQRFRLAEAAVLPWVVLSQTVPLIAIAPLVRRWGSQIHLGSYAWDSQDSVAVIAAYLAFFPVAVGMLRGLEAPDATHLDLMRTYGSGWRTTLLRLRLPASVPYLLPALRLAAAAAVIGTVVAEVSIGLRGGIGRLVIEYAQAAGGDPAKPWAPILGAVLVGLVAAGFVALLGVFLKPFRRAEVAA